MRMRRSIISTVFIWKLATTWPKFTISWQPRSPQSNPLKNLTTKIFTKLCLMLHKAHLYIGRTWLNVYCGNLKIFLWAFNRIHKYWRNFFWGNILKKQIKMNTFMIWQNLEHDREFFCVNYLWGKEKRSPL